MANTHGGCRRFEEELEAVVSSAELMRQQALLITERILGSAHKVLLLLSF